MKERYPEQLNPVRMKNHGFRRDCNICPRHIVDGRCYPCGLKNIESHREGYCLECKVYVDIKDHKELFWTHRVNPIGVIRH